MKKALVIILMFISLPIVMSAGSFLERGYDLLLKRWKNRKENK